MAEIRLEVVLGAAIGDRILIVSEGAVEPYKLTDVGPSGTSAGTEEGV